MEYTEHFNTKNTKQTDFIPGRQDQVRNSAGGVSFQASDIARLDRFLILGTEGGSYYATEKKLTIENSKFIVELIQADGEAVLIRTVQVSHEGLAPKNDPAIYVMALLCTFGSPEVKKASYSQITKVCRTGTHLFTFAQNIKGLRKWSAGLRRGVSRFYEARPADKLALQLMKYRQRGGWSQADMIRLAHPQFPAGAEGLALKVLGKDPKGKPIPESWGAFEEVQTLKEKKDVKRIVELVEKFDLPWEALTTEVLNFKEIWEALLPRLGYTALLRNLSRMSKIGLISEHGLDGSTKVIRDRFADVAELKKSRLHPLNILNGSKAYQLGYSVRRTDDTWKVSQKIVDVLDAGFYSAFANVEPTGKNFLMGLDISGSMTGGTVGGTVLSPREASVALALVTMNVEPECYLMGFGNTFHELKISAKTRLNDAVKYVDGLNFGSTDCSIPMKWAKQNKIPVDVFSVYTDSETYAGTPHPSQALDQYRGAMGKPDAKMIVVGMVANAFTIADPKDPRQLDIVGFSLDTPQAISAFARG